MGCRFEFVLAGGPELFLRAAAEEAIAIVEEAHARLTRFEPGSVVWRLNKGSEEILDAELLELFETCADVRDASDGLFDVARSGVLIVDRDRSAVRVDGGGVDLGAIGKGYTIDLAIRALQDAGVRNAFVHAGRSSARAIGRHADGSAWTVLLDAGEAAGPIRVDLTDRALSVSGDQQQGPHLVDPRTGTPAPDGAFGACVGSSAMRCDAWSTVLAIRGARSARTPGDIVTIVPRGQSWRIEPHGSCIVEEAPSCSSSTVVRS